MGTLTYNMKANGQTYTVKAKKDHVEKLAAVLHRMDHVNEYWRELHGVIGEEQDDSFQGYMTSLIVKTYHPLANPEKYAADKAAFYATLQGTPIAADQIPGLILKAQAIFREHLPVVDNRRTKEEDQEREQESAQHEADREAKRYTWIDAHCRDREKVEIPDGMMAIYLKQTYDDSDSQSDYYHPHAGHGEDMLLALVRKQPRTERLAREIVARYPELAAFSWSWHVEEWSMGHGTYLQSEPVGELEGVTTYGHVSNPYYTWEVQFNPYARGGIYAYKNYPGTQPAQPSTEGSTTTQGSGYTLTHDRDWTWLNFPDKPGEEIREAIKGIGARWSMKRHAWYFNHHVEQAEIDRAIGAAQPAQPEPEDQPEPEPNAAKAEALRGLADGMQDTINEKKNSATSKQNYTARRAKIAKAMYAEGERMERTQAALYALADALEAGACPPILAGLANRAQVETLQDFDHWPTATWSDKERARLTKAGLTPETYAAARAALLELANPPDNQEEKERRELENKARAMVGQVPGFFPTPAELADRMVSLANIRDGDRVLEPSAGSGSIADAVKRAYPDVPIDCIEWNYTLADLLKVKGYPVIGSDFLEFERNGTEYHTILMNPTFEMGQDIQHVSHAYEVLSEGGRLIAIMSEGTFFRGDANATAFRDWLDSVGGYSEKLDPETFKPSGAGVQTRLVVVDKPPAPEPEPQPEPPAATKSGQAVMFAKGEDLPIFSGTAPTVHERVFDPKPASPQQLTLF